MTGELFFASSNDLTTLFDYARDPERVVIDISDATIWDASTVASFDAIVEKYHRYNKHVDIVGMNEIAQLFHEPMTGKLGTE